MSQAMPEELVNIIEVIDELINDNTVPQSVRSKLGDIKGSLSDENFEVAIRISKVLDELEQISNDSNIPSYTRTEIWNITSALEMIQ